MPSDFQWVAPVAAFSGAGAALIAAAVALYIGVRNSKAALRSADAAKVSADAALKNAENAGRHRIAAFRQDWINTVIETLSDYHSIEMTKNHGGPSATDQRKLAALRTKLEILLNPGETDTADLLSEIDKLRASKTQVEREVHDGEIVRIARTLLKREWARIKTELA